MGRWLYDEMNVDGINSDSIFETPVLNADSSERRFREGKESLPNQDARPKLPPSAFSVNAKKQKKKTEDSTFKAFISFGEIY